jgi:hypothetical protein
MSPLCRMRGVTRKRPRWLAGVELHYRSNDRMSAFADCGHGAASLWPALDQYGHGDAPPLVSRAPLVSRIAVSLIPVSAGIVSADSVCLASRPRNASSSPSYSGRDRTCLGLQHGSRSSSIRRDRWVRCERRGATCSPGSASRPGSSGDVKLGQQYVRIGRKRTSRL